MIKGGYQFVDISGLDLTASPIKQDGLVDLLKNSAGKTLKIKLPGKSYEVEGVLQETTNNLIMTAYDTQGIIAMYIVAKATGNITVTESGASVSTQVAFTGTAVDLYSYDGSSAAKFYQCPSDGIVRLKVAATASNYVQINSCKGATATGATTIMKVYGNTGGICYYSFPVQKNMYLQCNDSGSENAMEFFARA